MSWPFIVLLALALVVLIGAEWRRVGRRLKLGRLDFGGLGLGQLNLEGRKARERQRRKASLTLIRSESDEFAASVERDLAELPTIEEKDRRR